jgi:hypothetical protein
MGGYCEKIEKIIFFLFKNKMMTWTMQAYSSFVANTKQCSWWVTLWVKFAKLNQLQVPFTVASLLLIVEL